MAGDRKDPRAPRGSDEKLTVPDLREALTTKKLKMDPELREKLDAAAENAEAAAEKKPEVDEEPSNPGTDPDVQRALDELRKLQDTTIRRASNIEELLVKKNSTRPPKK